ncbi:MAG TPA: hypothetical protein GXZ82_12975 [Firmicutes bacterium]|nr:hypothetical protein [Bacillota bacterium]
MAIYRLIMWILFGAYSNKPLDASSRAVGLWLLIAILCLVGGVIIVFLFLAVGDS